MPHTRILAALQDVADRHGERIAIMGIDEPDVTADVRRWAYTRPVGDIRRAANLLRQLPDDVAPRGALLLPETHPALWGAETAGLTPILFRYIAGPLPSVPADVVGEASRLGGGPSHLALHPTRVELTAAADALAAGDLCEQCRAPSWQPLRGEGPLLAASFA